VRASADGRIGADPDAACAAAREAQPARGFRALVLPACGRDEEAIVTRSFTPIALVAVLVVFAIALLGPIAAAAGQTSADSNYSGNLGQTAHGGTGTGGSATLPFTGLDLGGVAGAGLALIAAGAVIRHRAPRTDA
jgi:hypothetical protein